MQAGTNDYSQRPALKEYLAAWLEKRHVPDTGSGKYDMYFVMANGGASRSGYWTASVLGRLEDSSLDKQNIGIPDRFSDHVFCLSGTSGGGVGVATFFSLLQHKEQQREARYTASARDFLGQDYFSYTFARMLGPDYFKYIFWFLPNIIKGDRAVALEKSFEVSSVQQGDSAAYQVPFNDGFSTFPALDPAKQMNLPLLCINTTRMQDGNPGVVTNFKLDSSLFNQRVDVVTLLNDHSDISMASAAILGARFPYISPAGKIKDNYFVDGGYFDNSGAGVVQEMIRGIINQAVQDTIHNARLYHQIRHLHFKVLHITNSPVIADSTTFSSVPSIKNDLLAPVLTILGAYDMQTTVNDRRLKNFIDDIQSTRLYTADYTQVSLYKDTTEWRLDSQLRKRFKSEPSYAMNWFMSDTTRKRIDARLLKHRVLDSLISKRAWKD